ncbi:hypothetical protein [Pantoea anthophila]|uniref:hypothetical protein n=1 Tax=Pantoea anthophila TaxID=470931 RepID=UPI00278745B1|nr:hypothetical protein [Pantoea anthophila]MDQ1214919.1 hypothetical protein [Pantoea anthophila]
MLFNFCSGFNLIAETGKATVPYPLFSSEPRLAQREIIFIPFIRDRQLSPPCLTGRKAIINTLMQQGIPGLKTISEFPQPAASFICDIYQHHLFDLSGQQAGFFHTAITQAGNYVRIECDLSQASFSV